METEHKHEPKKKKSVSAGRTLEKIYALLKWFFSVDGAVITLLLLIVASIATYVIQDAIQRQRYLELLQLELRMNCTIAKDEITYVNNHNYSYAHTPIHTEVFNAGLQQGYIDTLDPKIQAPLYTLNTGYFIWLNNLDNHYMDIINQYELKWEQCNLDSIAQKSKNTCESEHNQFLSVRQTYSTFMAQGDAQICKSISQVNFNPTEDRIHSWLRYFMGTESLKIQQ